MTDSLEHGGALDRARARFGEPAAGWLDLSTGISPWPYPVPDLPADAWHRLPDASALDRLRAAAGACYGVADPAAVVAAPGSQALIQMLPRLMAPGPVAVIGFTYAEHAHCWAAAGHRVTETPAGSLEDEIDSGRARVVIVVNPNNPDGRVLAPDRLVAAADRLAARGGLLVVDEAFADAAPVTSAARWAGRPGLCILRSFGKFFGLAGLRLGFGLAHPALTTALGRWFGPWAVSGPAIAIGCRALGDDAWQAAARRQFQEAAAALDRTLAAAGLTVIGGTGLFRLATHPDGPGLYDRCGRAGVLLRSFAARPGWLRVGLPPNPAATARLVAALGTDARLWCTAQKTD